VTILNPISHIERWGFAFALNRLDITKTAIVHVLVRNPKNGQDIIFEISFSYLFVKKNRWLQVITVYKNFISKRYSQCITAKARPEIRNGYLRNDLGLIF